MRVAVDVAKLAERLASAAHYCTKVCSYREDCTPMIEAQTKRILDVLEPVVRRLEQERDHFESRLGAILIDRANLYGPVSLTVCPQCGQVAICEHKLAAAQQELYDRYGTGRPKPSVRTCKHCKRTEHDLGPVGMWQHCPEHEGGSLTHDLETA